MTIKSLILICNFKSIKSHTFMLLKYNKLLIQIIIAYSNLILLAKFWPISSLSFVWGSTDILGRGLIQNFHCPVGWGCKIYWLHHSNENPLAKSAGAVEYIDCFSVEGYTPPTTSVLDITLNNLIWSSSIAEYLGNAEYPFIAICS